MPRKLSNLTNYIISACLTIITGIICFYFADSVYLLAIGIALLFVNALVIPFFKYNFRTSWGIPMFVLIIINLFLFGKLFNNVGRLIHLAYYWVIVIKVALFMLYAFIIYRRFNPGRAKLAPRSN